MGSFFSSAMSFCSSARTPWPDGVEKINDSVYELHKPPGEPEFYVIFFHGLQPSEYKNAFWTTWSSDGRNTWPRTMLSKTYPNARILSISYDSCAVRSARAGRPDLVNISDTLIGDILPLTTDLGTLPVVLVGHSLGGHIIKSLILRAQYMANRLNDATNLNEDTEIDPYVQNLKREATKADQFLKNLKGIFYYATPHGGAPLADVVARLPRSSPVLNLLKSFSAETESYNQDFIVWRKRHFVPTYSVYELEATTIMGVNMDIVPEASARRDSDGYYAARANHINICKPKAFTSSTFQKLDYFIHEMAMEKSKVTREDQTSSLE